MKTKSFFKFLRRAPHQAAINHATAEEIAFGTAINVAPIDEAKDDWVMISPYGEFPNEKGVQVFNRERADKLVTAFNSVLGKLGRMFRGVPFYRGHPIQRPDIWPDDRRYGRVNALEARDDGLYGKVAWNDLGLKNKEQGYFVYPSPGWSFDDLGNGRIAPNALDHVGLTNSPNIASVAPITNSSAASAESSKTTTKGTTMPKWLIEKLVALNVLKKPAEGVEPTEQELRTAVDRLAVNVDPMEIALGQKKISVVITGDNRESFIQEVGALATNATAATNDAKKFKKLAIDQLLDVAVNDGRLTAAERPQWATKFEGDFDGTATALKEKQPALNTQKLNLSPSGKDLSDASKRRIAFNARLDELMAPADRGGKGLSINAAISFMRGNAEDAALLKAMDIELKPAA